jgi:hypothetical protein
MNFKFESKGNLILCIYNSNCRDYIGHAVFNSVDNEENYSVELGKQISKLRALKNHQEFEIYVLKKSIVHLVTAHSSLTNTEILITTDEILKYDFEDSKDIDILIKNIKGRLGNLPRSKTTAEKIFINTIYRNFKELNSRIHICAKYKKRLKEIISKL